MATKASKANGANIAGEVYAREAVTVNGLTVHVTPKLSDDWKLFKLLGAPDTYQNNVQLLEYVFGDDLPTVEAKFTDEDGFISAKAMIAYVFQVIQATAKN